MLSFERTSGTKLRLQTYRDIPEGVLLRDIGDHVEHAVLQTPALPPALAASWVAKFAGLAPKGAGDIDAIPAAVRHWPHFDQVQTAVANWLASHGLEGLLSETEVSLLGCLGAPFHADFSHFADYAFVVVWLSPDVGLDLYFPNIDHRVALQMGTVVLFDGSQPHGVVTRGAERYDGAEYTAQGHSVQMFLSWDVCLGDLALAERLGVSVHPTLEHHPDLGVTRDGTAVQVDTVTGRWC